MRTELLPEDASKEYNEKVPGSCSTRGRQAAFLNVVLCWGRMAFGYKQSPQVLRAAAASGRAGLTLRCGPFGAACS